jgi:hypothetical protein
VQLQNQYNESYIAADTTFAGENLPDIWQKSLERPQDLSVSEMRVMDALTFSPLLRWINLYRLYEAGLAPTTVWQNEVRNDVGYFYGAGYGRAWWEYFREVFDPSFLPPELKDFINQEFDAAKGFNALTSFRDLQEILQATYGDTTLQRRE